MGGLWHCLTEFRWLKSFQLPGNWTHWPWQGTQRALWSWAPQQFGTLEPLDSRESNGDQTVIKWWYRSTYMMGIDGNIIGIFRRNNIIFVCMSKAAGRSPFHSLWVYYFNRTLEKDDKPSMLNKPMLRRCVVHSEVADLKGDRKCHSSARIRCAASQVWRASLFLGKPSWYYYVPNIIQCSKYNKNNNK